MIQFSLSNLNFYDTSFDYADKPNDLTDVTNEQHQTLLNAINKGCIIFPDLTYSEQKPSAFHTWNGTEWIDVRTEEEKLVHKRSQYPKLTRYQFMRGMLEYGCKSSDIEAQIMLIEDEYTRELTMIGFKDAGNFVRTDSGVLEMQSVLGLSDEKVDELWEYALNL